MNCWDATVGIFVLLWIFILPAADSTRCPTPSSPGNGSFKRMQYLRARRFKADESVREEYIPGDEVEYSCHDGFFLVGNDTLKCMSNGIWSRSVPFCDPAEKLESSRKNYLRQAIDGNTTTCYPMTIKSGEDIEFLLRKPAVVTVVRLFVYGAGGTQHVRITNPKEKNSSKLSCGTFHNSADSGRWVTLMCGNNLLADSITITDESDNSKASKSTSMSLCEVQVFVKSKEGCSNPPSFSVENGYFKVWRQKADLLCEDGYDTQTTRVTCEDNQWKRSGELKCDEILCDPRDGNASLAPRGMWIILNAPMKIVAGTKRYLQCNDGYVKTGGPLTVTCVKRQWSKTNATCIEARKEKRTTGEEKKTTWIIIVSVVVIVVLLFLLGLTIYLVQKQKSREVVVVFKPSNDGSVTTASSEAAYYEAVNNVMSSPPLPTTPRPLGSPLCLEGYTIPDDCLTPNQKKQTPAEIAFGTLKPSSLYST